MSPRNMITLRKYVDVVKAEMDKSLLEAAGIPAFIAGENSAAIGYGSILAEIYLQVQDADVDRARQVLQDNQEATPLSDDFIPPEVPSLPGDSSPKAASEQEEWETEDSSGMRAALYAVATVIFIFAMFVAFRWWKNSQNAITYYNQGFDKWKKGNLDNALADFDQAIKLNSRYVYAYVGRANAEWDKGNLDGALADLDRAIALDSKDVHIYDNRGTVKRLKGDWDGALADFDKAIGLDPKDVRAYNNHGYIRLIKGDLNGAIADFDKAIELDSKDVFAYTNRGTAKQYKDDLLGAISDFDKGVELRPKDTNAYNNRGIARRMKGNLDGAISDYDRAIELDPSNTKAYCGRGIARYDERDWSTALSDFRKASAMNPTDSESQSLQDGSHVGIWLASAKLGERNLASDELKEYLRARTTGKSDDWLSTIERFLIGDVSEGNFLKAADNGDEKYFPDRKCEAYFYAGTIRLIDGDKSVAADYFTKCLETDAKNNYEYQSAAAELEALKQ